MSPADRQEFAQLVTDVHAYYSKDCSKFVLTLWWNACQNFELDQISKALSAHAMDPETGKFAPKVSDMVRILSGTQTDRAALAWGKVLQAISSVGGYQDIVFDDPAIHAAVADCGGWPKVSSTTFDELSYLQHRFSLAYKAYVGRGKFEYPRQLSGRRDPDEEYHAKGLPVPLPILFGDLDLAQKVYLGGESSATRLAFRTMPTLLPGIAHDKKPRA